MKIFKFVTKDIDINSNIKEIKKVVLDKWLSGEIYRFHYEQGDRGECLYQSILSSIAIYADDISDEIMEKLNLATDECLYVPGYSKSDKSSIVFEVLTLLDGDWWKIERLTTDDIPTILEFLDTPPGKELEAWEEWERYWDNLDYPARRKKLLENAEK